MAVSRSVVDGAILQTLRTRLPGRIIAPGDGEYDEARRVWNGRFDHRPGAIARCRDTSDVVAAVTLARERGLLVSVRSGGHDYGGHSTCEGGLVIDLSSMSGVTVDPASKTAWVQGGSRWRAFDEAAQAFGLATTGGTCSEVGVAGSTLGGGTGWLTRKHGLALDNLRSVEIVTATGDLLRASANEHDDLFWAVRGGSGNLGVVTAFEFTLHDVGPDVLAGQIIHPFAAARDVLRFWRSFVTDAPDELQCYAFFIRLPPLPAFPEALHNQVAIDLVVAYTGDVSDGERALAGLRTFGTASVDSVTRQSYIALQQAFDAGMPAGSRWYSKSHYLRELPDSAIDTILGYVEHLPGPYSIAYLDGPGGAAARVDPTATAFPHRAAPYTIHMFPGWADPADDERIMAWARAFHRDMARYATGGCYVNLLDGDETDAARMAYGANYRRLADSKRRYDPDNLFRMNINVVPAEPA